MLQKRKLLILTDGNIDQSTSRIRVINHLSALSVKFDLKWLPRVPVETRQSLFDKILFAAKKRLLACQWFGAIIFSWYDIVLIQRTFIPEIYLKILKRKKSKITYDFDDALYLYSQEKFNVMLKYSDQLTVASPFLAEYVQKYGKPCKVIYSPVDTDLIRPQYAESEKFTLGWIGSPWTVGYFETIKQVLQNFAKKTPFKLIVVGAELKITGVEIECIPWSINKEIEIARKIDVGIMPLLNDDWAIMKGGYKLFIYMAAGKCVVASPQGINRQIIKNGVNGYLASNNYEWLQALETLSNNAKLRNQMGESGRVFVETNYSYHICTPKLVEFLNS